MSCLLWAIAGLILVADAGATDAGSSRSEAPAETTRAAQRQEPLPSELATQTTRRLAFTAWASLRKKRQLEIEAVAAAMRRANFPDRDVRARSNAWPAWDRERTKAAVSAADRRDAAELLTADLLHQALEGKPAQQVVIVFKAHPAEVLAQFEARDSSQPTGRELTPILAEWNKRYGARLYQWDGYQFTLDVPRPPSAAAELRALAAEFALACPYARSGASILAAEEPPGHLMARLELTRWTCYWFIA